MRRHGFLFFQSQVSIDTPWSIMQGSCIEAVNVLTWALMLAQRLFKQCHF
jgi:hypothetical protein